MNWKHFLRGLGAGIIFTALIMLVAYMTSGSYRISDDEIIARAEKLGMVMEDKSIVSSGDSSETETESDAATENASSEVSTEAVTEEKTEETEAATTEKATTEKNTTEKVTTEKITTEKATETASEDEINTQYVTAEITVTSGMGSEEISKLVQDAGIIDDYKDFDNYLNQNGYSKKLSVNTFNLNSGMSYEEIAKELTKGDQ